MANPLVSDALRAVIEPLLPVAPVRPNGIVCVLTGDASTIQRLRQNLKDRGVKAYWAPGNAGLD